MRCVVRHRRELVADRTRQVNRFHADLEQLRLGYHHTAVAGTPASSVNNLWDHCIRRN